MRTKAQRRPIMKQRDAAAIMSEHESGANQLDELLAQHDTDPSTLITRGKGMNVTDEEWYRQHPRKPSR
jgi:hypothetical protein